MNYNKLFYSNIGQVFLKLIQKTRKTKEFQLIYSISNVNWEQIYFFLFDFNKSKFEKTDVLFLIL